MDNDQKIDAIYKKVNSIERYLALDDLRIERLESSDKITQADIKMLEKNQNRFFGALTIVGVAGTAFFSFVFSLFKHT